MLKVLFVFILLFLGFDGFAQTQTFLFSSQTRKPIPNVLVKEISHSQQGTTVSNENGLIQFSSNATQLRLSHVAFKTLVLRPNQGQWPDSIFMDPLLNTLDDLVLTGEIDKVSEREALYAVEVIDEKQLEIRGGNNAAEVLKWQQGLQISRDPILGSQVKINGLSGEHVKILVDGVELNGRADGFVDIEQIQTQENQKVEIVKGPVSLEYGSNALGGIIQFVSTDTDIRDSIGASMTLLAENTGTYRSSFHLVEAKKKHSLNLYFNRTYFDGWKEGDPFIESFEPEVADSNRGDSWNPKRTINGKIKYDVNILNGRLTSQLFYQHERITEKGLPFIAPDYSKAKDALTNSNRWVYQSTYKGLFNENHLFKASVNIQSYHRKYESFILDLNTLDQLSESYSSNLTKYNSYQGKFQASLLSIPNHKLSYGTDFLYDEIVGERILDDKKTQKAFGLWVKDTYQFNEDLKIQPGLRMNLFSSNILSFTPSVSFHYSGIKKSILRLSLSKGFRNPGLKDKFFEFIDSNHHIEGNEELKPEKSYHIIQELTTNVSDRVKWGFGLFYNRLYDQIALIQSSENANWFTYANFSKYEGFGGSTNLSYEFKKWNFELGYQLTADRVLESSVPNDLVKTQQVNFGVNKSFGKKQYSALNIKWDSEKSLFTYNNQNKTVRNIQDAFTFIDLSHHISFNRKLKISIWIKNLMNVTSIQTTNGSAHDSGVSNIARGRTLQLLLKYKL